jgi:acyl-CoA thioester hydrolase
MTYLSQHTIEIRVSYHETDGQGRVHHANYLNYFEQGRVELLRAAGASYKEFEANGRMLVVTEMNVRYRLPAEFDDCLTLTTQVISSRGARIRHQYQLMRGADLLVDADSTIACIDRQGRAVRLPPDWQR